MPLQTDLDTLPTEPGAYLMRDAKGDVLYVGKAVDLRARVKQYFAGGDGRFHVDFLVPRIATVEVVVVRTEREALILEDTLIKKYQPRYNVKLKDDKSWLSLRVALGEPFPRVTLVRRWRDDGARYFGPYLDEVNAREVVRLLKRTVPLRTCTDSVFRAHAERPCIEFQMGRCKAPCVGAVTPEGYGELVDEALLLLDGRNKELARRLEARMLAAAEATRFEEAGRVRDSLRLVTRLAEKQAAHAAPGTRDRDVFALHREGQLAAVAMVPVRGGRMQDARAFTFRGVVEDDGELLGRLITQLYSRTIPPPEEILTAVPLDDADGRAALLSELAERKVEVRVPQRGDGVRLVDVALRNAKARFAAAHSQQERGEQALFELKDRLHLADLPRRIECYDNSNIQGTDPVGAMVTFRDGKPDKAGYRVFKIRTVEGADDFATMREVLGRRVARALAGDAGWELPDLVVIDGGRGQLGMVVAACDAAGIDVLGPGGVRMPVGMLVGEDAGRRARVVAAGRATERAEAELQAEAEADGLGEGPAGPGRAEDEGGVGGAGGLIDGTPAAGGARAADGALAVGGSRVAGGAPAAGGSRAAGGAPAPGLADGGRGAEGAARPALRVVSIAKPREGELTDKIYEPGRRNPVPFRPHAPGLHLLQALRDEAHRFSVAQHRTQRRKRTLASGLDAIPGVGAALRTRLLRHFGSLKKVREADAAALAAVPGVGAKKAEAIAKALRG